MADPRYLEEMQAQTALLRQILAALKPATPARVDIDGPHGDPVVKAKDPHDWTGDSMKGRKFSECPPDYLDMVAERLDYFASKEEDAKKQKYNLLDAGRARAWAARIRGGWKPAVTERVDETQTEPAW